MTTVEKDLRPSLVPYSQDRLWSPIVAALIAALSIVILPALVTPLAASPDPESKVAFVAEKLVLLVVPLLLAALICRRRMSALDLGLVRPGLVRFLVWAIGGAIVLNVAAEWWNQVNAVPATNLKDYGFTTSAATNIAVALTLTVVAPLAEEFIFRGIFQRAVRDAARRWLPSWVSIAVGTAASTFFFVSIHGSPEQQQMTPVYILFGLITALAYEFTGSLYAAIFVHSATNAFAVLQGAFAGQEIGTGAELVTLAAPLIACALAWVIGKVLPRRRVQAS